tara:strand:- start:462 stop:701 length:240 start_codon:yes stop_codon:yes gene_type:complete
MKYKFENHNIEFENPEIEIQSDGITLMPSRMEISVNLILRVNGCKYGVTLENVKVENFNYDTDSLHEKVMIRLQDFKID